jgi:hypothetical protein
MSKNYHATAEAIEDDDDHVAIPFPEELGIEPGDELELERRPDGVIVVTVSKWKNAT